MSKPILTFFSIAWLLLAAGVHAQAPAPPAAESPSVLGSRSPQVLRAQALAFGAEDLMDQPSQSFQISLLVADLGDGPAAYEGLSSSARKALDDLKEFLPFTRYSLLDFAWLRSAGHAQARVTGPEDRSLHLVLRHRGPSEETDGKLFVQRFELRGEQQPPPARLRQGLAPRADTSLLSTSFAMEVGETVVVGTSRLKGDRKALVVLLTAVPAGGSR